MANTSRWIWILAMVLIIAGTLSGAAWYADRKNNLTEAVVVYPEPRTLTPFTLTDAAGQPFTEQNLLGRWSLVFVGYTHCPDICPTTLSDLARIYPELTRLSDKVQVVFVSADPARDTPERLKAYTAYFNPDFVAVTAEHERLTPAVQQLGLIYGIFERDETEYLVDHSASIALVNPRGQLHASFRPGFDEQNPMPLVNGAELVKNFSGIVAHWGD
ncbi:SCO family protein [Oceanisphaera arctica]|uniref:SCO family protein n=1 Tax=Oceanisphaera arctica TaxID=641510 RepID=A0A2P5TKK8_9GAMM|nr:SCO family protein [Oceanisphaera arctica]PPL15697.1 SCO family protein [Oceanisphaera arctica]